MSKRRNGPKTASKTYARFGTKGPVERGAVVKFYASGGWHKGIVLRLLPLDDFSRAYGRQAVVMTKSGKHWTEHEVGVGDMQILGYTKKMPKVVRESVLYR